MGFRTDREVEKLEQSRDSLRKQATEVMARAHRKTEPILKEAREESSALDGAADEMQKTIDRLRGKAGE